MSGDHDDDAPHEEHEEHANHEAWVIPYADLLTLLMAMFIALFAISSVNVTKAKQVAAGFNAAIGAKPIDPGINAAASGGQVVAGSGNEGNSGKSAETGITGSSMLQQVLRNKANLDAQKSAENRSLKSIEQQLQTEARKLGISNQLSFELQPRGLVVRIVSDNVLFPSGSADLQPTGLQVLRLVGRALKTIDNPILIEGHTDNVPVSSALYRSNWGLSTARAESVLLFLVQDQGLAEDRMRPTGWADLHPIASNSTPEGRAKNRRVELVIQSKAVDAALQANGLDANSGSGANGSQVWVSPQLNQVVGNLANGG